MNRFPEVFLHREWTGDVVGTIDLLRFIKGDLLT